MYSFAGNRNFGDDYIASEWIRYAKDKGYKKKIFFSAEATWLQAYHLHDDAIFNNVMPAAIYQQVKDRKKELSTEKLDVQEYVNCGKAAANVLLQSTQWRDLVRNVTSLQICGGGFLNSVFPHAYAVASMMQRMAEKLSVPLYGTGLGLCPMDPEEESVRELFEGFEIVECRDRDSFSILQKMGGAIKAKNGYDDTFLTPVKQAEQPSRRPALFVNIQSDSGVYTQDIVLKRVLSVIESVKLTHEINYVHFFQNSDAKFLNLMKRVTQISRVYDKDQLFSGGLPIQRGDLCITSRFHMHLLAARLGAKGAYLVGRQGYYDIKHKSNVALGSNWVDLMRDDFVLDSIVAQEGPSIDELALRREKQETARKIFVE